MSFPSSILNIMAFKFGDVMSCPLQPLINCVLWCTEEKQHDDENVSPFSDHQTTVEVKTIRKAFVPPLRQKATAQEISGESTVSTRVAVVRSGYNFSRPPLSKLHIPGQTGMFSEDHRKRNTQEQGSLLGTSTVNTQNNSEGVELADHTENYHVSRINCPDVDIKVLQNN